MEEHWTCIQTSFLTIEICKILNSLTEGHEFESRFRGGKGILVQAVQYHAVEKHSIGPWDP